jgi:class 3 adenylate cyclase/tetratricopeptide (TPR) repeat protein
LSCPTCGYTNPETAKFCNQCGTQLPATCLNCRHENPPDSKFCNNCGHQLAAAPRASSGLPAIRPTPSLAQGSGAQDLEGERRNVTVLFCDVTGSTAASERLDPEDWTEIMNGVFGSMVRPVHRYEGTVARLMGDGILAFFGAPVTHEDDPQRAVLAGLGILAGFEDYRAHLIQRWNVDISLRVGINTGLVVVGVVGSDERTEYTAMGDAINVAARMEQTAQPGTVQIAEDTYRTVAPFFEVADLGGISVKGKSEPVRSYRVLRARTTPGRLRGIEGLASPLVGRTEEIGLLAEALTQLENGMGGVVCLLGEAGLGKSRLISELHIQAREFGGELRWYETVSLSYETDQAYGLFRRLIRRLIGASPGDAQDVLWKRLDAFLGEASTGEREDERRVFEAILGLRRADDEPPLEGETFKGQLCRVMTSLWEEWASAGPIVLVCDDLHWSDPASVALLQRLLTVTERHPCLILCAMRPDRHAPGWELRQVAERDYAHRYSEISLVPLTAGDSGQLVDNLLRISDLPPALRARIMEKSEGNPFFVEEVVRTLIENGIVVQDESGNHWQATGKGDEIEIPDNLQALLMARFDRLDEGARRTLQLASVVGRSFYYRVLARIVVADPSGELERQLLTLQRTQLIREASRMPELEYVFRHALTQEAAYSTILHRQRRTYHRKVAGAIESLFPDRLEEMAVTLAYHYYQAQDAGNSSKYFTMAGDVAFQLYALAEAVEHYGRAIALASRAAPGRVSLVHLYTRRGRALELQLRYDEALENYAEMAALADERGDRTLKLAHLLCLGTVLATGNLAGEAGEGRSTSEHALSLARELGDRRAEARALWNLMLSDAFSGGDLERARSNGEASLAIARELGWAEQIAYTLEDLSLVLGGLGQHQRSQEALDEAQPLWRSLNNLPMLANNLNASAVRYDLIGKYDMAIQVAEEGMQVARSVENIMSYTLIAMNSSLAFRERGLYSSALRYLEEGIRLSTAAGADALAAGVVLNLALIYADLGLGERGLVLIQGLEPHVRLTPPVFRAVSRFHSVQAHLHLTLGNLQAAQEAIAKNACDISAAVGFPYTDLYCIDVMCKVALAAEEYDRVIEIAGEFIAALEGAGLRRGKSEAYYQIGSALAAKGELEGAREALNLARSEADTLGARRVLWQSLVALADVEERCGRANTAGELQAEAREVAQVIAERTPKGERRAAFLSLPPVRRLFANTDALWTL